MTRPAAFLIPGGDAGVRRTLQVMTQLAKDARADPDVLRLAAEVTARAGTAAGRVGLLREWLTESVRFAMDPLGVETVRAPRTMLEHMARTGWAHGDCDDVATLAAALALAAGMQPRFRVLAFVPRGPYSHVYTEILAGGTWLELDTTRPHQGPLPPPARAETFLVV